MRCLKHPSFRRYSSYGHNKGGMERGEGIERRRQSDRDKDIESERKDTEDLKK